MSMPSTFFRIFVSALCGRARPTTKNIIANSRKSEGTHRSRVLHGFGRLLIILKDEYCTVGDFFRDRR